jgi:hypothetical protein
MASTSRQRPSGRIEQGGTKNLSCISASCTGGNRHYSRSSAMFVVRGTFTTLRASRMTRLSISKVGSFRRWNGLSLIIRRAANTSAPRSSAFDCSSWLSLLWGRILSGRTLNMSRGGLLFTTQLGPSVLKLGDRIEMQVDWPTDARLLQRRFLCLRGTVARQYVTSVALAIHRFQFRDHPTM